MEKYITVPVTSLAQEFHEYEPSGENMIKIIQWLEKTHPKYEFVQFYLRVVDSYFIMRLIPIQRDMPLTR